MLANCRARLAIGHYSLLLTSEPSYRDPCHSIYVDIIARANSLYSSLSSLIHPLGTLVNSPPQGSCL